MVVYSDVVIKCGACGYTASEWEFATDNTQAPLQCPKCRETANLQDAE